MLWSADGGPMVIMMVMDDDWNFVYQSVLLLPISRFNVTKVRRRKASRCFFGLLSLSRRY